MLRDGMTGEMKSFPQAQLVLTNEVRVWFLTGVSPMTLGQVSR